MCLRIFITFAFMKTKKHLYIGITTLLLAALVGCGEKKQNSDIIVKKPAAVAKKTIQRVGDYSQSMTFEWGGANYTVAVERKADATLPLIDDGSGNQYYDNCISVRIIRSDGSDFFNRKFTKQFFKDYVGQGYQNGALLGIVFDRVEDGQLRFAASVGSPDKTSDEYVPMVMKISRQGDISVARSTELETNGDTGDADV